jgi:hypothetical protein
LGELLDREVSRCEHRDPVGAAHGVVSLGVVLEHVRFEQPASHDDVSSSRSSSPRRTYRRFAMAAALIASRATRTIGRHRVTVDRGGRGTFVPGRVAASSATLDARQEVRAVTYGARWSIVMTILGLVTALTAFAATGSVGWALVGLLGSGMVTNAFVHPRRGR